MKNKKIASLLVAGALTVGVVGGTLAWLTASDHMTNNFRTGKVNQTEVAAVEIKEEFDDKTAGRLLPGTTVKKEVKVQNTATFDQFIRVKLTYGGNDYGAVQKLVTANFDNEHVSKDGQVEDGKWVKDGQYYYYVGKLAPQAETNDLLKSVTFSKNATIDQMNKAFKLDVDAESVQASNGAFEDVFTGMKNETLKAKLRSLQATK